MSTSTFTVTVLGFDGAFASAVTGALDIFSLAGVSWQRFNQQPIAPKFHTQVASWKGEPFTCTNRIILQADLDIRKVEQTHVLLIPTIGGDLNSVLANSRHLHSDVQRLAASNCDVVSNCSGAFLLAEMGLLEGRVATTHWGYAERFQNSYPNIQLDASRQITRDGNIYCAGGGVSFQDMCLLLIERYCGRDVANQVAKAHVINRQSGFQNTYANFNRFKQHRQPILSAVQEYIENHFNGAIHIPDLANRFNVTERTLHRYFVKHTGLTPSKYIQAIRIENAKRMLEQNVCAIKSLPPMVGYEDLASFSRLFKRYTGFTLVEYRSQFNRVF